MISSIRKLDIDFMQDFALYPISTLASPTLSFFESHNSSQLLSSNSILRIGLWIDSSSTLFSGFGPVWLLFVPKLKNLTRWEEILVKWGSHCRRHILQTLRQPTSNDYQTWTMRPFWLKFGLKGFEEWIFRDVASSNGL